MDAQPSRPSAADRAAFHAHLDALNSRRSTRLALASALLLGLGSLQNVYTGAALTSVPFLQNFIGFLICFVLIVVERARPLRGWSALMYGWMVLAWGDVSVTVFVDEVRLGHAFHASQQFVLFFIPRYLAPMSIVWRPRSLAIALVANHVACGWILMGVAGWMNAILFPGMWSSTAFLVAYLIYRAERDAFLARRDLQRQRDELSAANLHLERLNQEKNDLMAIAAHDLRSPLIGIATLLQLAADDAARVWGAGVATLKAVEQSARDMADLVSRVLDVHQASDAVGGVTLVTGDIRPIVTDALAMHRARAESKAIALAVVVPEHPCQAWHDAQALARVLDNLTSNALKFTPRGGRVDVRVSDSGQGPVIAIADSGPGIGEEERSRLFRKFARLRAKPTEGESSSGLGLYIVKRLVDAMRGSITVESAPGAGATFTVQLSAGNPESALG